MKNLSTAKLALFAAISLLLVVLSTYLWATLTGPVSAVSSIFVLVTGALFVVFVNASVKRSA